MFTDVAVPVFKGKVSMFTDVAVPVFKGKVSMFTDVAVPVFKGKVSMFTDVAVPVFEGKVFMFTDVDDVVVVQEFSEGKFMFTGKSFTTVEDADVLYRTYYAPQFAST